MPRSPTTTIIARRWKPRSGPTRRRTTSGRRRAPRWSGRSCRPSRRRMPRTIRFHLDEDVDPAVAEGLRRRGVDVTTSREVGLLGTLDTAQLAYAKTERSGEGEAPA